MLKAAMLLTMICGLALAETGCSLSEFVAKQAGGFAGSRLAEALPVSATVKPTVNGGDVCSILPELGWPRRLPEKTVSTIDGTTLRVILDTNDTVAACPSK
jgi:hypothetical protein